jgi:hypothetical protein
MAQPIQRHGWALLNTISHEKWCIFALHLTPAMTQVIGLNQYNALVAVFAVLLLGNWLKNIVGGLCPPMIKKLQFTLLHRAFSSKSEGIVSQNLIKNLIV